MLPSAAMERSGEASILGMLPPKSPPRAAVGAQKAWGVGLQLGEAELGLLQPCGEKRAKTGDVSIAAPRAHHP